ncbi:MAG: hypothetical protein E5X38_21245 [Mesorhizobium sp.]|uniref:hypothetical protein n=1 Tax=Mesorhizobium sp. TaxID=1871066 RepID=UPI0011F94CA2|nr:hypothetical protein [Mesorhizobium sp.]TIQ85258.1 MAG: hypothetical protein E5X38_21245 [Mesorhizobium sp.]
MAWSNAPAPEHWPSNVKKISIDGLDRIGIDPKTNELFWDGQKLVTERKLASFERWLAFFATLATCVGAFVEVGRAAGWWL